LDTTVKLLKQLQRAKVLFDIAQAERHDQEAQAKLQAAQAQQARKEEFRDQLERWEKQQAANHPWAYHIIMGTITLSFAALLLAIPFTRDILLGVLFLAGIILGLSFTFGAWLIGIATLLDPGTSIRLTDNSLMAKLTQAHQAAK
jgi:uncharacterized membrane protein